jgi:hypothetical protein
MRLMKSDSNDRSIQNNERHDGDSVPEDIGLESFLDEILQRFQLQLRERLPSMRDSVINSGRDFLFESRRDLERWTGLLAAGTISQEEFEWLVQARVHLAEMQALLASGLTLARIDELRISLVQSITGAAFHLIGL